MKILFLISFSCLLLFIPPSGGSGACQYTVLHKFNDTLGKTPLGSLTVSGNTLYGMTWRGDTNNRGIIFSIHPDGTNFKKLYGFSEPQGTNPWGSLTFSGNTFYGTASGWGAYGAGTVFSIQTNGTGFTDIHDFNGVGSWPGGTLTLSGNTLYGMTWMGGAYHDGIIFSVQTNGSNFKDLHDFNDTDGAAPYYGQLALSGDTLYGMTAYGCAGNYGVIFSIQTNGANFKVLHYCPGEPCGSLLQLGNTLYGMTSIGGAYDSGMVFSIQTNGAAFTDLHDFNGTKGASGCSFSLYGNTLYGMTYGGGTNSHGTIFSMWANGSNFKILHNFKGSDGEFPYGDLTILNNCLYGMTAYGGFDSCSLCGYGVIFKDSIGPLSINEPEIQKAEFDVYPNPSKGIFTIQYPVASGQWSVEIYNMLGQKIYQASLNPPEGGTSTTTISLINMAAGGSVGDGIYLYRVTDVNEKLVGQGKIIIEH